VLGDHGGIFAVTISPDDHTLAAGSVDGSVRLFDISNVKAPTFLSSLTDHIGTVYTVAFSPDGHTLASGSLDGTVRLWDTDPDEAIKNICSPIVTPLTRAQWQQYIPGLPYKRPCLPG
jgi:WD40 repeat protein